MSGISLKIKQKKKQHLNTFILFISSKLAKKKTKSISLINKDCYAALNSLFPTLSITKLIKYSSRQLENNAVNSLCMIDSSKTIKLDTEIKKSRLTQCPPFYFRFYYFALLIIQLCN